LWNLKNIQVTRVSADGLPVQRAQRQVDHLAWHFATLDAPGRRQGSWTLVDDRWREKQEVVVEPGISRFIQGEPEAASIDEWAKQTQPALSNPNDDR